MEVSKEYFISEEGLLVYSHVGGEYNYEVWGVQQSPFNDKITTLNHGPCKTGRVKLVNKTFRMYFE